MSAIVNPHIVETRPLSQPQPDGVEVLEMVAGILADDDPGVALDARYALQQPYHRRRQYYPPRAGLPVP